MILFSHVSYGERLLQMLKKSILVFLQGPQGATGVRGAMGAAGVKVNAIFGLETEIRIMAVGGLGYTRSHKCEMSNF